jgi:hypothetical protein
LPIIPETEAPLAAALEYGGNGTQPLDLVYIDTNGHVQRMQWDSAGAFPSGPFDLGQPSNSPIVKAVGKPSMVFSLNIGGERIFVKGSDGAVWMHYGNSWTSLGGRIYGDPKAIVWSWQGGTWTHVFALGTDDNLYGLGILNGTSYGWGPFPNGGTYFVSSPTVVTRDGQSLDMFAVGEDGTVKRMSFTSTGGWTAPATVFTDSMDPTLSTPTVAVDATGKMPLFVNGQMGMGIRIWDGSAWNSETILTGINQNGSLSEASWGPNHFDVFSVTRNGALVWWYTDDPVHSWGGSALVPQGSAYPTSGDPLAISRYANEVEVFYRTSSGELAHWTYSNGAWGWPMVSLPQNSIR